MRYVAAYLLAVLGGNSNPSAKDIKNILGSVGIEADDERLNKVQIHLCLNLHLNITDFLEFNFLTLMFNWFSALKAAAARLYGQNIQPLENIELCIN